MNRLLLAAAALLCAVPAMHAQAPLFTCSNSKSITLTGVTASGNTQIIAAPNLGRQANIYVCSYTVQVSEGATAYPFSLTAGTGTACATGNTYLTAPITGAASSFPIDSRSFTSDAAIQVPANNAVCLTLGGAVTNATVNVRYVTY